MWISLIFDGIIAVLLGVTIFYCTLVNRRLGALRSSKDELKQVIEDLTVATTNAQMSIAHLKEAGREVVGVLEDDVRKGRALSDELSLMVEAGNNLANRLEGGRAQSVQATRASVSEPVPARVDDRIGEGAIEELRRHEAAKPQVRARVQVQPQPVPSSAPAKPQPVAVDSGVENELLKALRRAR